MFEIDGGGSFSNLISSKENVERFSVSRSACGRQFNHTDCEETLARRLLRSQSASAARRASCDMVIGSKSCGASLRPASARR